MNVVSAAEMKCVDCHDDIITDKAVPHQPAVENCTNCHKKHPGAVPGEETPDPANPLRLKKLGNALCANCHDGISEADHPVSNHPTERDNDPVYTDKKFGCVSCHNPHGSQMPKLFRYNYSDASAYKGVACAVCHWDMYSGGRRKPKRPDWKTGE